MIPDKDEGFTYTVYQPQAALHRLPRACEVSSVEISKSHLDVVLCNLRWVALLQQ